MKRILLITIVSLVASAASELKTEVVTVRRDIASWVSENLPKVNDPGNSPEANAARADFHSKFDDRLDHLAADMKSSGLPDSDVSVTATLKWTGGIWPVAKVQECLQQLQAIAGELD